MLLHYTPDALELGVWAELEPDELEASALAAVRALAIQSEAARMLVYCLSVSSFFSTSLLMPFLFVSSLFVSVKDKPKAPESVVKEVSEW